MTNRYTLYALFFAAAGFTTALFAGGAAVDFFGVSFLAGPACLRGVVGGVFGLCVIVGGCPSKQSGEAQRSR